MSSSVAAEHRTAFTVHILLEEFTQIVREEVNIRKWTVSRSEETEGYDKTVTNLPNSIRFRLFVDVVPDQAGRVPHLTLCCTGTTGQTAMRGVIASDVTGSITTRSRTFKLLMLSLNQRTIGVRTTRETAGHRS